MCDSLRSPWTIAQQAPLSMRFPRQEYWSGLPFSSPGNPPDPGMESTSFASPELADILYHWATGEILCATREVLMHEYKAWYLCSYLFRLSLRKCVFPLIKKRLWESGRDRQISFRKHVHRVNLQIWNMCVCGNFLSQGYRKTCPT